MSRAIWLTWCWCGLFSVGVAGEQYDVGPGQSRTSLAEVPWETLGPGDQVRIHWRPEPYREKWVICRRGTAEQPIWIRGMPGPEGQLPVIDGRDAVTPENLNYWNEERSVVKIGGANRPPDTMPAHLLIENLEIRSGRPPYRFQGRRGDTPYAEHAASLFIEKGESITVRGCVLHDSGNGLFVSPDSRRIVIQNCYIYDNGIEGSIYQHNSYTQAAGILFQGNRFGPLRKGCSGNNLKDRSAGLVIRYNWIDGGNRPLDLVDATGVPDLLDNPAYRNTFVYGNVLIKRDGGNNQVVHYGGDSGTSEAYRHGTLHFYHNTVISHRRRTTSLLRLSTERETVEFHNNLVYATAGGSALALMVNQGTLRMGRNGLPTLWRPSHTLFSGRILDEDQALLIESPVFEDFAGQDFRPARGSPYVGAAGELPLFLRERLPVTHQYVPHQQTKRRPVVHELGAFERVE